MAKAGQVREQEAALINSRWSSLVLVGSFSIVQEILLRWLSESWALSIAWFVVFGVFITILYITKPELRTQRRRLLSMLIAWLGGAIAVHFYLLLPHQHQQYPLWASGVFWGAVTSLLIWLRMKRKQNNHALPR